MAVVEPIGRSADTELLRESLVRNALSHEDVVLSNGQRSSYYIDAKAALLTGPVCAAVGRLVAARARELGAKAVGGLTMGADPLAVAAIMTDESLLGFFVRKERKEHGLQRWIEGPKFVPGTPCMIVDDVVTTGSSTIRAIELCSSSDLQIVGTVCVLDRLAGGGEAIRQATGAPFSALATIDDIFPDRPDK